MPSASFNPRGPASGGRHAHAIKTGEITVDPAAQLLIDSNVEPRWGLFLRTWEALAAAKGRYPARAEIDPAALGPKLLPNIFLVDVVAAPDMKHPRFRFRLLGQVIVDREPTRPGDFLDQIGAAKEIAAIEHHYRACIAGKVWIRDTSLTWTDNAKGYLRYKVMLLPLSEDGSCVTNLIGLALYEF